MVFNTQSLFTFCLGVFAFAASSAWANAPSSLPSSLASPLGFSKDTEHSVSLGLSAEATAEIAERIVLGSEIREAVSQRLAEEQLEADVKLPADKNYYACLGPLSVSSKFSGWKTVEVSCASPESWELVVRTYSRPLRLSVDAGSISGDDNLNTLAIPANKKQYERAVLLTSLQAGDIISPSDVELKTVSSRKAVSGFARLDQVIGRRLKHSVNTGMPVQARYLQPNWIIEENQSVMIEHNHSGIMVVTAGKALKNGRYGELIQVQNNISGDIIQAYVNSAKKVTVLPKIGSN
jgi:flagella basal body P-ring formation protein FlgA